MNNIEDILNAIGIGLVAATFLLNTGRGLKAIDICKECFIFLNNELHVLKKEEHIFNSVNIRGTQRNIFTKCNKQPIKMISKRF